MYLTAIEDIATIRRRINERSERTDFATLGPWADAGLSVQTCHMAELFLAIVAYDAQETKPEAELFCFLFKLLLGDTAWDMFTVYTTFVDQNM